MSGGVRFLTEAAITVQHLTHISLPLEIVASAVAAPAPLDESEVTAMRAEVAAQFEALREAFESHDWDRVERPPK